jgi:cytochrome c oxidase subunit 3
VVRRRDRESEGGLYGRKIDLSYRWSMSWFIFSEVMFFGAFFTALWWARVHSVPSLGSLDNALLWPDFKAVWPSVAARRHRVAGRHRRAVPDHGAFLAAHHQHRAAADLGRHADHRPPRPAGEPARQLTIGFMWITVILGIVFLCVQGYEYYHAYRDLNLKLVLRRLRLHLLHAHRLSRLPRVCGHADAAVHHAAPDERATSRAERHFGFEGAAWYWHFVDVVWLGLYVLVYWM